ncbi:SgcJ/EcaC family oxidoreductase [Chlorogloeopsis sp. ULAP02]|uniref:SgcJ/EcaC family oxidoreductase n=1 Tax=Chlorogloeopsis sp. ULAP02 TaxID=3107926 RepID=UPI0031360CCE
MPLRITQFASLLLLAGTLLPYTLLASAKTTFAGEAHTTSAQKVDETAIRQVVQKMQDGQNSKNGQMFASAFAKEHDYIVIDGKFLPNQTREANARAHQALYDGDRTSSLGGNLGEVGIKLNVAKIRFLTPQVAIAHIESQSYLKSQPDKRANNIITTVMQKQQGKWEIVAFHNAPVQKTEGDDFGFVIDIQGLTQKR